MRLQQDEQYTSIWISPQRRSYAMTDSSDLGASTEVAAGRGLLSVALGEIDDCICPVLGASSSPVVFGP
ncbi:hypothetical protein AB0H28_08350 [Micromonospora sp. NPDC050980]|uniref:hypothetical protein n=1 Tax=Micromonospora sp. NPDC050980 TaxID=3155161 RepID=UPI0033F75AEA